MKYHDFDIWIDNRTEGGYPLRACCYPHGEERDISSLDPESDSIRQMQTRLAREDTNRDLLTAFGSRLYSDLFSAKDGNIDALFQRCRGDFLGSGKEGIRIRLRIEAPKLAALPWEFLYSRRDDCFLGTSIETPVVRYLELAQPIRELEVHLPLRMLVAVPEGSGLSTEMEISNLSKALKGLNKEVETRLLDREVTRTAISDALLKEQFHVFHFVGHGEFQNDLPFLLLNDGRGGFKPIDHQQFGGLFLNHPTMKLVLLNSCKGAEVSSTEPFVGMASQLVRRGVPAVIAMQYPIGDDQAILFAREFYRAIFQSWHKGRVEMAVSQARNNLLQEFPGDRVVGTPVLFTRAPEGVLFDPVTGNRFKDLPLTRGRVETAKAAARTHARNIEIWEKESEEGPAQDTAGESLSKERAELARLKERIRLGRLAIFATLLVAPVLFGLAWLRLFDSLHPSLKIQSYAIWFLDRRPASKPFSDQIAIVASNEQTQARFQKSLVDGNWRIEDARLVDTLSRAGAKVIVFDNYFETPKQGDDELSTAIQQAKARGTAVIVGVNTVRDGHPELVPALAASVSNWGIICLRNNQGSLEIVPLVIDQKGPREHPPIPSLALAGIAAYRDAAIEGLDRRTMKDVLLKQGARYQGIKVSDVEEPSDSVNYCGVLGAGSLVPSRFIDFTHRQHLTDPRRRFAYEDILAQSDPQRLAFLRGKIVVVGVEAPVDLFRIRRGIRTEERYGFELHADAMNTLLQSRAIRPLGNIGQLLLIVGLSLTGGFIWFWKPDRRFARYGLLAAAVLLNILAAGYVYGQFRILLHTIYHLPALLLSYWVVGKWSARRKVATR